MGDAKNNGAAVFFDLANKIPCEMRVVTVAENHEAVRVSLVNMGLEAEVIEFSCEFLCHGT